MPVLTLDRAIGKGADASDSAGSFVSGDRRPAPAWQAGLELVSVLDLDAVAGRLVGALVPSVADWCAVLAGAALGESPGRVLAAGHRDESKSARLAAHLHRYGLPEPLLRKALHDGETITRVTIPASMLRAWTGHDGVHDELAGLGYASTMLLPIPGRGGVLAVLVLACGEARRERPPAPAAPEELVRFAAIALENARCLRREQRSRHLAEQRARRLERVLRLTDLLSYALTPEEAARTMAPPVRAALGAKGCAVWLTSVDLGTLEAAASDGSCPTEIDVRVLWDAVTQRGPLAFPTPASQAEDPRAALAIPLVRAGRPLGVIVTYWDELPTPDHQDRMALQALAHRCTEALERTRLMLAEEYARTAAEASDRRHRELAQRLAEVDRRKDEFLALLGHELRNPLAAVSLAVELMKRKGDERTARERQILDKHVHHLCRLVDDLLDMSRINAGKINLQRRRVDLDGAVRRALEMVAPQLARHPRWLDVDLAGSELAVDADEVRLVQIVQNLLTNAIKYTRHNGRVRVQVRHEGQHALVAVSDDGVGLSPALLARAFEPFVQGDGAPGHAEGGLGLGLTLVRELARLHDGEIVARSDGPGKGAEFTLRLPAVNAPTRSTPSVAVPRPHHTPRPRRSRSGTTPELAPT